jgi:hypothetical protein
MEFVMSVVSTFFRVRDASGKAIVDYADEVRAAGTSTSIGGTYEKVTLTEKVEPRQVVLA